MASSSSSASSYSRPVSLSTFPNPPGVSSSFITSVDEEPVASTSSLPAPLSLTLSLPSPGLADLRASFLSTSTPSGSPLIRPLPPVPGRGGPAAFAYGHGRSMSDASSPAPLSSRSRAIRALPVPPQNTGSSSSSASSSSTIQEEPRSRPTTIPPPPPPKEEESTQKKIDKDGYPPLPPIPPHAFYHHAHPIINGNNTLPLRTKRSKSKLHLNTHVYVSPSARAHYDNFTAAQQQQLDSPTMPFTASTARPPSSAWTVRGGGGSGTQTPRAGPGSVAMSRSNSLARSRSRKARSTKGKSAGSGLRVAVGAKDDAASLFGFPYAYEDDGRWVEGDSPSGRTEIDWGALEDALVLADDGFVMDGYEYAMPEFGYAFDDIGVGIRSTEAAAARHHLV
ncbi:hypothetical protein DL93DRAFT_2089200 [Clavulina sp. PMI_390]|nr:hypothetical protein DL93DRAFT_2089200 [Clavulina sp. PMI_390]